MQPPLRIALVLLLLAGLGCEGARSDEFCHDNGDCETRLTCFQNRCLLLEPLPAGFVWEILPSENAMPVAIEGTDRNQPLALQYCEATVEGDAGDLGALRVDVEGEASGLGGVCHAEQHTVEGEFSLRLPPGKWRLVFHPANRPPIVRNIEIPGCGSFPLGPLYQRETSLLRFLPIQGRTNPEPRCGIRAQVFGVERGEPLSAPLSIQVDPESPCRPLHPDGWELEVARPREGRRIAVVLETADPLAPVMRQAIAYLDWMPEAIGPLVIDTASEPAERVILDLGDGDGLPVDGARIQASWPGFDEGDCLAPKFRGTAPEAGAFRSPLARPTSLPGGYELWLPPGPYLFRVVPPAATDLAAKTWAEPVTVRPGGGNVLPLRLERKPGLEGTVINSGREPVAEVRVRALPLRGGARMAETASDAQGGYRLQVDPGPYLLLFDPPTRTLPRSWSFLEVREGEDAREDREISPARTIAGRIQGEEGGLPHTLIRAWDTRGAEPVVAGEALTDASGRFVLRVRR